MGKTSFMRKMTKKAEKSIVIMEVLNNDRIYQRPGVLYRQSEI